MNGDSVSIHTLVHASHEILYKTAQKKGITSHILDTILSMTREDKRDEFGKKFAEAKNFFKHLYPDPNAVLDFNPEVSSFWLWDACQMYQQLAEKITPKMKLFIAWFNIQHDDLLLESPFKKMISSVQPIYNSLYSSQQEFYRDLLPLLEKQE